MSDTDRRTVTPPKHADFCEAEFPHDLDDCAMATELARLRAFAEGMREEFPCTLESVDAVDHADDCVHCAATEALGGTR